MYLISSGSARLAAEILRYISGNLAVPEPAAVQKLRQPCCVGRRGLGDPSDRAAALPEFRYCPLPRACNTWSENTYKIHMKPL
ncbi:hypothetical protein DW253_13390 [Ruminococcus sp. AM22-13]|nr:hypothetical protein DW253_13390 [Ruminococcus sp. AM22-13]